MAKQKVYLAGPVSNCNEKQRNEWRKELSGKLKKLGYESIDPARHTTDTTDIWTPLLEMVEIDRSDVVIANLWRESIGTVLGIVQARRRGKPVILIDQNYLDSLALEKIVGEENIVHSIEGAVNKLRDGIAPQLQDGRVLIRKRNGKVEPFRLSKLHKFLNALCVEAEIADALLPELVAKGVHGEVKIAARKGSVESGQITEFVRKELQKLSSETDKSFEEEIKQVARRLSNALENSPHLKGERRALEELGQTEKALNERIAQLEAKNEVLKSRLNSCEEQWALRSSSSPYDSAERSIEDLLHVDFLSEYRDLPKEVQDVLVARIRLVEELGPQSGRPHADTLNSSRHANMKELRFDAAGGVWRVAFAFDPNRQPIFLVAGDKSGGSRKRFYSQLIEKADERFSAYLSRQTIPHLTGRNLKSTRPKR